MTLLHLMQPLSPSSLDKCIELLQVNKQAQPIDFLRIHALRFASTQNEEEKKGNHKKLLRPFRFKQPRPTYLLFQIGLPVCVASPLCLAICRRPRQK